MKFDAFIGSYLVFEKIAHFSPDSFVFPSIIPPDAQVLHFTLFLMIRT